MVGLSFIAPVSQQKQKAKKINRTINFDKNTFSKKNKIIKNNFDKNRF